MWCRRHNCEITVRHLKEDHYADLYNFFMDNASDYFAVAIDAVARDFLRLSDEEDTCFQMETID